MRDNAMSGAAARTKFLKINKSGKNKGYKKKMVLEVYAKNKV